MPSDVVSGSMMEQVQEALAPAHHAWRAAVEAALARGDAWWSEQAANEDERAGLVGAELGVFANGRVDPRRFAALFARPRAMEPGERERVNDALKVLRDASAGTAVVRASVAPGGSLSGTIGDALAGAGRAFAAVRVIEGVRAGRDAAEPPSVVENLPFRSWSRAERRSAPPLVVTVAGSDLHAAALGEYADGRQKIVLVVDGPCPPAALVRLVTPGTLVMQTSDVATIQSMARFDGPAIAAIVPDSAASFTHDPAAGPEPWQRLSIQRLPSSPFAPVRGMSTWQLREDLRQLEALAAVPANGAIPPGAPVSADSPDAVDRLTAWLLGQSDLTGLR